MIEWVVKLAEPERWFYGIVATIVTGLIVALANQRINHALAARRERRKNIIVASAAFRAVVNPESFKGIKGHVLHGALIDSFPILKAGVHEYRIHLGWLDGIRLDRAWAKYHGGSEQYPELFKPYCIKDNGPELLKHRLESLRKIGEKR